MLEEKVADEDEERAPVVGASVWSLLLLSPPPENLLIRTGFSLPANSANATWEESSGLISLQPAEVKSEDQIQLFRFN